MKTRLSREFTFDAAHSLPGYPGKCARIHGHTYTLIVTVEGDLDQSGMVMDFFTIKEIVERVVAPLDHHYLNDFYEQPTLELVAGDLLQKIQTALETTSVNLYSVKLYEGTKSAVEVFP
ncbi:MAG: 6-carboxytetrahydropterin synthase QueD [Theionarchaea archaeon]|nr:6-carboxytetrahydropterin synthase QueD [Theionarchaea archaeon]MBU6999612.1 6-carboxytetrahydropterin synthase QueD [Theionarchaea archaeon]MBU7020384.1 6-carboxytetrahydropterin synthase QueD [Theionarchaea archaeon]MBU7035475.1 6-carboxytetrahydropterin synthase QueD [Theionarchaea archaeon]